MNETINIAINTIFKRNPNLPINRTDLKMLFSFATTQSHFLFNDFIYDQMDGVTMGSPLAPILANLFMGHHEKSWLENYKDSKILIYRRYVDDIFCAFDNEHNVMLFFDFISAQHPNIKFTHEKQLSGELPIPDVLVDNSSNVCVTSVFHKKTYTGLLTNFFSFTPLNYKTGLIRALVDRTFKINNTNAGLNKDLNKLSEIFKRNCFPSHFIDKITKQYLRTPRQNPNKNVSNNTENTNIHYLKLPYIGNYSRLTQIKIRQLCKRFCKDLNIKLVFSTFKIKTFFSFKDPIPTALKSFVVYEFTCAGCNSRYIGETSRHFSTRINEHTLTDRNSHVFKHLNNSTNCKNHYTPNCFKILDSAKTTYTLKLKEAIHSQNRKPELNTQIQHIVSRRRHFRTTTTLLGHVIPEYRDPKYIL